MASIYVYRSDGVVAFSNRPMLLPYVFGDAIRPDPEGFAREATCDAFVGSISPVMGVKPLGPGEAVTCSRHGADRGWVPVQYRVHNLDFAPRPGAVDADTPHRSSHKTPAPPAPRQRLMEALKSRTLTR
jgi:hypothetical protein